MRDVLQFDEAYADQMAYRDHLFTTKRDAVHYLEPKATAAANELLDVVLDLLPEGFAKDGDRLTRPDGVKVFLDRTDPLMTAARLIQEDLVILQERDDEHALTGAALAFPASWSLAEKSGHGLLRIHAPVDEYSDEIGKRVQRLFNGLQSGRPIMRANWLLYADPDLHQPRREDARRDREAPDRNWVRVERQTLLRLPESRAVVFFIHTYVVAKENLDARQAATLQAKIA